MSFEAAIHAQAIEIGKLSLEMTAARSIPYFLEHIRPLVEEGKNVLVSAHGNSLRSIIMKLDSLSEEEVLSLELATGVPVLGLIRFASCFLKAAACLSSKVVKQTSSVNARYASSRDVSLEAPRAVDLRGCERPRSRAKLDTI